MSYKVYLVDDEPDLRRAIERLLRAEGFKVESHGSALEFLARLPAEADGCVVMDLAMPGLDGAGEAGGGIHAVAGGLPHRPRRHP